MVFWGDQKVVIFWPFEPLGQPRESRALFDPEKSRKRPLFGHLFRHIFDQNRENTGFYPFSAISELSAPRVVKTSCVWARNNTIKVGKLTPFMRPKCGTQWGQKTSKSGHCQNMAYEREGGVKSANPCFQENPGLSPLFCIFVKNHEFTHLRHFSVPGCFRHS